MERIEAFTRDGKNFIYIDVSNVKNNNDFTRIADVAQQTIGKHSENSVHTIINIENILFDTETKEIAAKCLKHNNPYVKYSVVIGLDSIKKIMVNAVLKLSGRNKMKMHFAYTKEQAIEWLLQQV